VGFIEENNKENTRFVHKWAEYVRTHSDEDWSKQQNVIINSALRTANMTREQFFKMKGETHYVKFNNEEVSRKVD
jgi:hypothetical protein